MVEYSLKTLIIWIMLMINNYELLSKMISKNPMIPYMIGLFIISLMCTALLYLFEQIICYLVKKIRDSFDF